MRLAVIAVGRLKDGPERELCERYRERGVALGREAFATRLATARDSGTGHASLIIGGADGLSEEIRDKADITLAFGALTIPHQIVRALVLEQLYRAMTIISGHPYHRV